VSVDCFVAQCFVVEDKHRWVEVMESDPNLIMNGVTLVIPRDEAWPGGIL